MTWTIRESTGVGAFEVSKEHGQIFQGIRSISNAKQVGDQEVGMVGVRNPRYRYTIKLSTLAFS